MKSLFFLLIFSFSFECHADNLAYDMQWIRFMHYQKTFSGWESEVDSPQFFLNPKGKFSPEAELQTTIEKFSNETPETSEENSIICRFPARYQWLKNKGKFKFKERSCARFEKWFQALRGNSISLVFSSYYINNPSSSFGHTLLRVNKEAVGKDGRRYELLDYGINYAANADTSNALLYAINGLIGGFPGTFTTVPYYYEVREYNNAESRDLWEYELSLSPEQVDRILAHVWELGPNWINYWYLTENCSYYMIALLEAGDPNLKLTAELKKYVIPSDTVQVVWNYPGLVRSVKYRPSIRTEFYYRLKELSPDEKDVVAEVGLKKNISSMSKISSITRRRKVLDAAIDFMDFRYPTETQNSDSRESKFKNLLLTERTKIDELSEPLGIQPPSLEQPHLAHTSRRMNAGGSWSKSSGNFLHMQYKFALHDQLDPIVGYPEYAQISFFDLNFDYSDKEKKFELDRFSMFEVVSNSPIGTFSKSLSWRINVGAEKIWDSNCFSCHGVDISGGAGYTLLLPTEFLTTLFLGFHTVGYYIPVGPSDRFLAGIGPQARMRVRLNKDLIFLAESTFRQNIKSTLLNYQESSFLFQKTFAKNYALRGGWESKGVEEFVKLDGVYYY